MRFRSQLTNIVTFSKLTASLASLGKVCWMRLEDGIVRLTIIPDQGTQVWAQLPIDAIFDEASYTLQSNSGVINLEVPIGALHRALRSATGAHSAQLRLTQKGNIPLLALTILSSSWTKGTNALGISDAAPAHGGNSSSSSSSTPSGPRERETVITQEVPVKVLHESAVRGLHEPRCRDPDVHIILPSLVSLKNISERFAKLAADAKPAAGGVVGSVLAAPKLELSANMHGSLKLAIATDALCISSVWSDLVNPPLDPAQLGEAEIGELPSERMRALGSDDEAGWAKVRIDAKDWGRVLSVGRLSPKVVACFIHDTALILYVYLPGSWNAEDSCLTYYINSYAA
ncbi:checkpoint protein HUS1 family protein [Aspergillus clavatus NRRL 1]|uniref:Checkpoint protein n=1 Tax=Aspergillus clavatus (strain ATCC 1007 / CBS 513.65 / DSM 816 / NCTC 3887 / NRRL 1 / QM 1276 / 107) TaxID=344612 RepID=A1CME4_ASPCL|nr:cell cycle checkpoint protein (Hus1), putative [Aspergillus clavatus NRRL 1]EAW08731.1 cell cycle checkpoint protein (Hus1), putative [Aspergillus clavatus NRRL 1]